MLPILKKRFFGERDINLKTAIIICVALVFLLVILFVLFTVTKPVPRSNGDIVAPLPTSQANSTTTPKPSPTIKPTQNPKGTSSPSPAVSTTTPKPSPNVFIPEETINIISNSYNASTLDNLFMQNTTGTQITSNNKSSYSFGIEEGVYIEKITSSVQNYGLNDISSIFLVDIDNDTQDEIAIYENTGDPNAAPRYSIMENNGTGQYKFSEFPSNLGLFEKLSTASYLKIGDKTFFLVQSTDTANGSVNNVSVFAASNGKIVERALISNSGVKYLTEGKNATFARATKFTL